MQRLTRLIAARLDPSPSQTIRWYSKPTKQERQSQIMKEKTPVGEFDKPQKSEGEAGVAPKRRIVNEETGEVGGPQGPEPTRYGDWERKGRVSDF